MPPEDFKSSLIVNFKVDGLIDPIKLVGLKITLKYFKDEMIFWEFAKDKEKYPVVNPIYIFLEEKIATVNSYRNNSNNIKKEDFVKEIEKNRVSFSFNRIQSYTFSLDYLPSQGNLSMFIKELLLSNRSEIALNILIIHSKQFQSSFLSFDRLQAHHYQMILERYEALHQYFNFKNFLEFDNTKPILIDHANVTLLDIYSKYNNALINVGSEFDEIKNTFGTTKEDILRDFETKKGEKIAEFDNFLNASKENWENELKAHADYLKLKEPAKYWQERKSILHDKMKNWIRWAAISSGIMILILVFILFFLPDSLKKPLSDLAPETIRSLIILLTIVSIGVYIIRLFIKLALSSYHMSMDADERYNLTLVYLALLKDGKVKQEELNIVLQSIFSRVETGLVKSDSSPAMPFDVNIIKSLQK